MSKNVFSYQVFNIPQNRGIVVYAITLANVIHNCMCVECGMHPKQDQSPVEYFRANVIPTFKKHDKWMQDDINERDFCWFTLGQLINMDTIDSPSPGYWKWALEFKDEDITNTILNIIKDASLAINIEFQQSPLN
jgi:hypothetical protein